MRSLSLLLFLVFTQITFSQVSRNIDLIGRWNDSQIPFNGANNTYNECWGFVQNGREYGVLGSREGVYIIDVTDSEYPNLVQFIQGASGDVTNRDFHDYNGYLYLVADQGASSLQIVDLRSLPDSVELIYDSDTLFSRCHNIFIDSSSARLYACSVSKDTISADLEIYSLAEPTDPKLLLSYDAVARFHDIYVKNDTAFGNNEREGMFIYDFTDVNSPKVLGAVTDYPEKGYNHSGWTSEDGDYYFFADENNGLDLKSCDIRDYDNIEVLATFNSGVADDAIAHNLIVLGNFLYVSYYHDGLRIFDIADPANPIQVGYYDTYLQPDHQGGKGAWGVYPFLPSKSVLVSDREKGLFIFDVQKALLPVDTVKNITSFDTYPNPFFTVIKFSLLNYQTITSLKLYDIQGRMLVSDENLNFRDNAVHEWNGAQHLTSGIYLLEIRGQNVNIIKKVIKAF